MMVLSLAAAEAWLEQFCRFHRARGHVIQAIMPTGGADGELRLQRDAVRRLFREGLAEHDCSHEIAIEMLRLGSIERLIKLCRVGEVLGFRRPMIARYAEVEVQDDDAPPGLWAWIYGCLLEGLVEGAEISSLIDLLSAAERSEIVVILGREIECRSLTLREIAGLLLDFPELRKIIGGDCEPNPAALIETVPIAAAQIIAAGTGHAGDKEQEAAAVQLPAGAKHKLAATILRLTTKMR